VQLHVLPRSKVLIQRGVLKDDAERAADGVRLLVGSWPSIRIVPDVGRSNVVSILMVVDFPAPFGPRNPKVVPCATENEIPFTASKPPKRLLRSLTSMMLGMFRP
jgi:hypothetical protein